MPSEFASELNGCPNAATRKTRRHAVERKNGSKIRMIEDVEGLGAELESHPLVNRKLPPEGEIHLPRPKTPHQVPRCVACAYGLEKRWM